MKPFARALMLVSSMLLLSACSPEPTPSTPTKAATPVEAPTGRVFNEGAHYTVLSTPILEEGQQRYLTEFFWLGCPHCQNFEPVLKGFLSAHPDVTLIRKHPALGERWAFDASIFYALEFSGHSELVTPLFELYRQTRESKNSLPDVAAINNFMQQQQLDAKALTEIAQSEQARQAMEQANRAMLDNRIQGVPSLVVNGKYLVNNELPDDIAGMDDYYELLNFLLNKP